MGLGDANAYLDLLKEIVNDLAASGEDREKEVATVVVKMKNTISDQASVNKKLNTLLQQWREDLLPKVVEGYDELAEGEKMKYSNMNNFWCGLHFIVGLSEQANKTLAQYEDLISKGEKLGAVALPGGYSKAGESGTSRLVRTVCKAIQERGCERTGKPVEYQDFMTAEGRGKVPLAPFKGNRFNILFHNAAGIYFMLEDLKMFMADHKTDNKLFTAVNADLNVLPFQAGIRALGLISKLVTGPLWRALEKEKHNLGMVAKYQELMQCFQLWSQDATPILHGSTGLFDNTDKEDNILQQLTEVCDSDAGTKQVLELLFSSFLLTGQRQLKDYLGAGKFGAPSAAQMEESVSCPTSNVGPERTFAMLDNIIRVMPSANTIAIGEKLYHDA